MKYACVLVVGFVTGCNEGAEFETPEPGLSIPDGKSNDLPSCEAADQIEPDQEVFVRRSAQCLTQLQQDPKLAGACAAAQGNGIVLAPGCWAIFDSRTCTCVEANAALTCQYFDPAGAEIFGSQSGHAPYQCRLRFVG